MLSIRLNIDATCPQDVLHLNRKYATIQNDTLNEYNHKT